MINFKEMFNQLVVKNIISKVNDIDDELFNVNENYMVLVDESYMIISINIYEDGLVFMANTEDYEESEVSQVQVFETKPIMEFK